MLFVRFGILLIGNYMACRSVWQNCRGIYGHRMVGVHLDGGPILQIFIDRLYRFG